MNNVHNLTPKERAEVKETICKAVKAAMLISGADKRRYGKLRDKLANNYLLGTNQYPNTFDKAVVSLGITRQASKAHPSGPAQTTRGWLSFSVEVAADEEAAGDAEGEQEGVKELVEEQTPG